MQRAGVWIVAVVIAFLGIALGVQTRRAKIAQLAAITARAEKQAAALEAADFKRATERTQDELAGMVLSLEHDLDVARAAGARVAAAGKWEGHAGEIGIPLDVLVGKSCEQAPPGVAVPPPAALSPRAPGGASSPVAGIDPWFRLDEAIAINDLGAIYVKRKAWARLEVPASNWRSDWKEIPKENVVVDDTGIDPEIEKAWRAYKLPTKWTAYSIGASIGVDGPGVVGGVAGGGKKWGWWVSGDYLIAEPEKSRIAGGASRSMGNR